MAGVKFSVHTDGLDAIANRLVYNSSKAGHAVAIQIAKDTEDYVPMLTGSLKNRTLVMGDTVIYPGPYARYLYYGKVMVFTDPPYLRTRKDGKAVLTHFGQRKTPIDKALDIKKTHHKHAQAFWFEASKAQNLDKWKRVASNAVTKYGNR